MRIGEVAHEVGVTTSAIRFYEESGLLPEPERTPSGYRDYHPSIVDRLAFVRAGQAVGLTLGQLREVLQIRDRGIPPCSHVAQLIDHRIADIDQRIEDLVKLRRNLSGVAGEAKRVDPEDCPPESVCRILTGHLWDGETTAGSTARIPDIN
jgi:MerR family transcriptional regulator, Zn(II)-responsive regulator of zntA